MATAAKAVYSHVTKQPGVRGGKACIDDTRIAVVDVVALLKAGKTPTEMLEAYPSLSLAQVHAALSYYYENAQEIDQVFAEDDAAEAEHDLAGPEKRPERRRVEIPVCREGGGSLPGVDLDDSAALLDIVEGQR